MIPQNELTNAHTVVRQVMADRAIMTVDLSDNPVLRDPEVVKRCLQEYAAYYDKCVLIEYTINGNQLVITAFGEVTISYKY